MTKINELNELKVRVFDLSIENQRLKENTLSKIKNTDLLRGELNETKKRLNHCKSMIAMIKDFKIMSINVAFNCNKCGSVVYCRTGNTSICPHCNVDSDTFSIGIDDFNGIEKYALIKVTEKKRKKKENEV